MEAMETLINLDILRGGQMENAIKVAGTVFFFHFSLGLKNPCGVQGKSIIGK